MIFKKRSDLGPPQTNTKTIKQSNKSKQFGQEVKIQPVHHKDQLQKQENAAKRTFCDLVWAGLQVHPQVRAENELHGSLGTQRGSVSEAPEGQTSECGVSLHPPTTHTRKNTSSVTTNTPEL